MRYCSVEYDFFHSLRRNLKGGVLMNRKEILEAASSAVHAQDQDHDYGKPEDNFETIADLWSTYMEASYDVRVSLGSRDVAAMLILLKVARAATSTKSDHWVDIAGYAACGGEIDGTPCEEEVRYADNQQIMKEPETWTFTFKSVSKDKEDE